LLPRGQAAYFIPVRVMNGMISFMCGEISTWAVFATTVILGSVEMARRRGYV
jgi:hypothetical protein